MLAQLFDRGGLAISLAGKRLHSAHEREIDIDEVRELLKAARRGDRFQPELRELVAFDTFAPPVPLARYRLGAYWHELQEHDPFLARLREHVAEIAGRDR